MTLLDPEDAPCPQVPLFGALRWKVEIPIAEGRTVAMKGISEQDAQQAAHELGGRVFWSRVWLYDDGTEVLEGWHEADVWVRPERRKS